MAGQSQAAISVLIPSTGEIAASGWGSSGAATRKLHGLTNQSFSITETVEPVPMPGYYGPSPVANETQQGAEFSLEGVWLYDEAPKFLNGFFTYTSASTGAAAPYDFYWSAPVASTQANATYGLEFGTSGRSYRAPGCIFNNLTLTGEAGSYWKYTVGGFAKQIQTTTNLSTSALADARSQTAVAMADTTLYLESFTSGTFGGTTGSQSGTLISFELTFNPNRHLKYFAGSKFPQAWGDARNEGTLRTVVEFTSGIKGVLDELIDASSSTGSTGAMIQRMVRIKASATSTVGTSGFVSCLDFAGAVAQPIQMWGDRDGNCTLDITWTGKFSTQMSPVGSTAGNYLAFQISKTSSATS